MLDFLKQSLPFGGFCVGGGTFFGRVNLPVAAEDEEEADLDAKDDGSRRERGGKVGYALVQVLVGSSCSRVGRHVAEHRAPLEGRLWWVVWVVWGGRGRLGVLSSVWLL